MTHDLAWQLDHEADDAVSGIHEERDRVLVEEADFTHLVDILRPEAPAAEARPAIVFCHGGGFVHGDHHARRGRM